jgi:two-component system cell cycle sensor histidine kinase/response regulator CckA
MKQRRHNTCCCFIHEELIVRILVAEDEEIVRRMAVRILERAGYEVIEAENGEVALSKFREDPESVDLALVDVVMPRKNGFMLRQELLMERPELPILLTSGYSESIVDDLSNGADDFSFLRKPYNRTQLLSTIESMIKSGS